MKLAPCKHGLQEVARVHRAVGLTRADYRMKFVDEKNDFTFALSHLVQHGFKSFLELASKFRARDKRADIEGEKLSVFKVFRHVAFHYSYCKPFRDSRFTDARFTYKHGVVFGFSRKNTDDVSYLVVTPDNRVELTAFGFFDKLRAVFVKHVVSLFGIIARYASVTSYFRKSLEKHVRRYVEVAEKPFKPVGGFIDHSVYDMLDGNKIVVHLFSLSLSR